jgi:hypothetical protein
VAAFFIGQARDVRRKQQHDGVFVMAYAYQDMQQQMPLQNPQHWNVYGYGQPQGGLGIHGVGYGLGQAAYGQFGQPNIGAWGQGGWGQRQLSQQDVGEVVRQLVPLLPVVLAQAQQQPMAAIGYGGYNQGPRMLTPHDVNEVVRQILPIVPQIVGLLQGGGQWPHQAGFGAHGGLGQFGQPFQPQFAFGQAGMQPFQAAFGGGQGFGQQRHLTQQDIGEVVRQLTAVIPQVINNLQTFNQQRAI